MMMGQRTWVLVGAAGLVLTGCASTGERLPAAPVRVSLIAFNDFHGALEPHQSGATRAEPGGNHLRGGVAALGAAIGALKAVHPNHLVLSAGDMIGATPFVSAHFLDEPTITAMNLIGVDFNAVGNHEFDRGQEELRRMQEGGCDRHTTRTPCAVEPFGGADFPFLAANTLTESGATFFPGYAIRTVDAGGAAVRVAIVGLTLRDTPSVTAPSSVVGLRFADEAETVNALIPTLKREGAEIITILIHQGGEMAEDGDGGCGSLEGPLVEILQRLSPEVDVVVSGHTHHAYVCNYEAVDSTRPFLVTSAGHYGSLVTEITIDFDTASRRILARAGRNIEVAPGLEEPMLSALVARYAEAARPLAARSVGYLSGPALRDEQGESALGNLVADAQFAAAEEAGAKPDLALMNRGGLRADLIPGADGSVRYGDLFAVQPFGNEVMVVGLTGAELKAALERLYLDDPTVRSRGLFVSNAVRYAVDRAAPEGTRVHDLAIGGARIDPARVYRVALSNFLASGGDRLPELARGRDPVIIGPDLDALERYITKAGLLQLPSTNRVRMVAR